MDKYPARYENDYPNSSKDSKYREHTQDIRRMRNSIATARRQQEVADVQTYA